MSRRACVAWIICGVLCGGLSGCAGVASLADSLNARQVTSCVWAQGSYGPFMGLRVVTATGGADLKTCLEER